MSLRDRLFCLADFVGTTLLALLFLLPLPNCFLRVCLPTLFAAVLKFFYQQQHLQFLAQQIPSSQHPRVLRRGRCIYEGMEMWISK